MIVEEKYIYNIDEQFLLSYGKCPIPLVQHRRIDVFFFCKHSHCYKVKKNEEEEGGEKEGERP